MSPTPLFNFERGECGLAEKMTLPASSQINSDKAQALGSFNLIFDISMRVAKDQLDPTPTLVLNLFLQIFPEIMTKFLFKNISG